MMRERNPRNGSTFIHPTERRRMEDAKAEYMHSGRSSSHPLDIAGMRKNREELARMEAYVAEKGSNPLADRKIEMLRAWIARNS